MAPKMGEGGEIWLKCITGDLIMMIRDKNNIFERVENFHADLAWNYPVLVSTSVAVSAAITMSTSTIVGSSTSPPPSTTTTSVTIASTTVPVASEDAADQIPQSSDSPLAAMVAASVSTGTA